MAVMSMPTLFPGKLTTREKPYDSLTTIWAVFANLKYNISPAIDGGAFDPVSQGPSSHAPPMVTTSVFPTALLQRDILRPGRPDAYHGGLNVSITHSRRDPFSVATCSDPSMIVTTRLCIQ